MQDEDSGKEPLKTQRGRSYKHGVGAGVVLRRAVHVERNLLPFTAAVVRTHGVHRHLHFNLDTRVRRHAKQAILKMLSITEAASPFAVWV